MKMTKLETFHIQPRWLFLKIHTDGGIVGWGESVLEGRACTMELTKHHITSCCRSVPNSTTLP
jgi:galactonate dehydratase